jgi:hypothetical protein
MASHCWRWIARGAALALMAHAAVANAGAQERAESRNLSPVRIALERNERFDAREFLRRGGATYAEALAERFAGERGEGASQSDDVGIANEPRAPSLWDEASGSGGSGLAPELSKTDENSEGRWRHRHANLRAFVPLSAAVYAMGLMDQTATVGNYDWRNNERDPLVKPFTHLPTPLFVATGVAFESGVNWLAWKMSRSRSWHKIWWLPQLCAIGGNAYGYKVTTRGE